MQTHIYLSGLHGGAVWLYIYNSILTGVCAIPSRLGSVMPVNNNKSVMASRCPTIKHVKM